MSISKAPRPFFFNSLAIMAISFVFCSDWSSEYSQSTFRFCVADVGQGLSQFGYIGGRALVWDLGPGNQYSKWKTAYGQIGEPYLEAIIISHTDEDHLGGLSMLDSNIGWSGNLIISSYEDTAKVRAEAGFWKKRISFKFCGSMDTVGFLDSVLITCLWPPEGMDAERPLSSEERNRLSMVFLVQHGNNRVLITSDIDSLAQKMLCVQSGYSLSADILIAPHHGSAGSVDPIFFGYVSARKVIFSCSRHNSFGHPSTRMVEQCLSQGSTMLYTFIDGSVIFESNGFYW